MIKSINKHLNAWFVIFIILDMFVISCFFVFYGPFGGFRNFFITTSMRTMTHQYLAKTFYTESMIHETISKNYVTILNSTTDASQIVFSDSVDTGIYESVYEEQILKRDEGNDLYKYFSIEINNTTAHVAVIYDPSRIEYALSKYVSNGGQTLKQLAKSENAIIAMNASGFSYLDKKIIPAGVIIKNGKILYKNGNISNDSGLIGFNKDHVLVLTKEKPEEAIKNGLTDAMTFGPFLVVNGEYAEINGNGGWGYAPRSVIAQRKDGIVLFIVFDGRSLNKRSIGASMNDLIDILKQYKAYNAANLDGGGSSTLVINGEIINQVGGWNYSGDRYLPDAFIVK